jgi:Fungal specific transcription factor domain
MQNDFQALHRMFPKDKSSTTSRMNTVHLDLILAAIPPRNLFDQYFHNYVSYFEGLYRIFHVPSLIQEYNQFWDTITAPSTNSQRFLEGITPQLALIAVVGHLFQSPVNPMDILPPVFDPRRTSSLVEGWVVQLNHKRTTQLSTIETLCLLVLSKQMLSVSFIEIWHLTGDLVRSALAIGLHKDPLEIDLGMPLMQVETRRRLWCTITELDMQYSTACCLPSLIQATQSSCKSPSGDDTNDTPEHNSIEVNGDVIEASIVCSQATLAKSLPVRLDVLRLLTQVNPSIHDIRETLADIELQHSSIAQSLPPIEALSESSQLFQYVMLDMVYRRPITSLRTLELQCIGGYETIDRHYDTTKTTAQCMTVLSLSEMLDPDLSDLEIVSEDLCWKAFQAFYGDDIIRAAYCACLSMNFRSVNINVHENRSSGPPHDSAYNLPKSSVRRMIDDVIKSFVKRKPDLRIVLKQIMGLGIVNEATKHTKTDSGKQKLMRQGLERVLQLCREICRRWQ